MSTLSMESIVSFAVQAGFRGDNAAIAGAIAMTESGGDVGVVSKPNKNGTVDRGLWQINSSHSQYDAGRLTSDPLYNAQAAFDLSHGSDFGPWSTYWSHPYTSGKGAGPYTAHLADARAAHAKVGDDPEAARLAAGGAVLGSGDVVSQLKGAITNPLDAVASFLSLLTSWDTWRRVLYVTAGAAAAIVGLVVIAGDTRPGRELIEGAAGAATLAA